MFVLLQTTFSIYRKLTFACGIALRAFLASVVVIYLVLLELVIPRVAIWSLHETGEGRSFRLGVSLYSRPIDPARKWVLRNVDFEFNMTCWLFLYLLMLQSAMVWLWGINVWVFMTSRIPYSRVFELDLYHISHKDIWKVNWKNPSAFTGCTHFLTWNCDVAWFICLTIWSHDLRIFLIGVHSTSILSMFVKFVACMIWCL